jgi:hypothetical protein
VKRNELWKVKPYFIVKLSVLTDTLLPCPIQASRGLDVVAHELTHGFTSFSSGLIYNDESGALNEGMSDIFGSCVDRIKGLKSVTNTWRIGEDIYTPGTPNDALRYMNDPALSGVDIDFYPDRERGDDDNGYVHTNSGIANLAFVLMVQGGTHPRGKSSVVVPAIDPDFDVSLLKAVKIFYMAQTSCFTPMTSYFDARQCTLLLAGDSAASVAAAWDAVGVNIVRVMDINVPVTGLSAPTNGAVTYQVTGISPGTYVTCTLSGNNGDADLYMDMNGNAFYYSNVCDSTGPDSHEICDVGPSFYLSTVSATIKASTAYTDLTLACRQSPLTTLTDGVPVTNQNAPQLDVLSYVLPEVEPLTTVTCTVKAGTGTAPDVYGALLMSGQRLLVDPCSVFSANYVQGTAVCTLTTKAVKADMYLSLYSSTTAGFSGMTVTCSLKSLQAQTVSNWALSSNVIPVVETYGNVYNAVVDFRLDGNVKVGESVTCLLGVPAGLLRLINVYYGDLSGSPEALTDGCSSGGSGPATNVCTANIAVASTGVYAEVLVNPTEIADNYPLVIVCGRLPASDVLLTNGVPVTNQVGAAGGDTAVRVYRLDGVQKGEYVTCQTQGANGDANLFVNVGARAIPYADTNTCVSGTATSNEVCSTPVMTSASSVYVSVHASKATRD